MNVLELLLQDLDSCNVPVSMWTGLCIRVLSHGKVKELTRGLPIGTGLGAARAAPVKRRATMKSFILAGFANEIAFGCCDFV